MVIFVRDCPQRLAACRGARKQPRDTCRPIS
jgi:hypothetical protein